MEEFQPPLLHIYSHRPVEMAAVAAGRLAFPPKPRIEKLVFRQGEFAPRTTSMAVRTTKRGTATAVVVMGRLKASAWPRPRPRVLDSHSSVR